MIAADDDELFPWIEWTHDHAGDFLANLTLAAMFADFENYPLMRPLLLTMKEKYPMQEVPQ